MPEPLKDHYNSDLIKQIAAAFHTAHPPFPKALFVQFVLDEHWESRELKERMNHVARGIQHALQLDYKDALDILLPVASQFRGLAHMLFPAFVELFGQHDWENSMRALVELTPNSSSEFAVRPFLKSDPEKTIARMREWAEHPDKDVRRLASEGCRPRLPWAMALPAFKKDPTPILPILQQLKDDDSEYVRRSVANNLNDIAKDHPELVLDIAEEWLQTRLPNHQWIAKHACRTLLKQAHPRALELFGFSPPSQITLSDFEFQPDSLAIGEDLHFSFTLSTQNSTLGKIRAEYAIYYKKARGQLSKKVFKISEQHCESNQKTFKKKQSFQERTTRKHHPGEHKIAIIINGEELIQAEFQLTSPT